MPAQRLDKVAARLAVDAAYRERCRQGLQAAVGGAGAGAGTAVDVLGRVRRLNEYLATGLVLDDGNSNGSSGTAVPLPWQQQQPLLQRRQEAAASVGAGSTAPDDSESQSDSDIEEGSEGTRPGAGSLSDLLAAAQASVERRQSQAALAIQCAFRRHLAWRRLQQLRAEEAERRRLAAARLVARILKGAYCRVCGLQRQLARQGLRASLRQLRRCRWRVQRRRQRRQKRVQHAVNVDAGVGQQAASGLGHEDKQPAEQAATVPAEPLPQAAWFAAQEQAQQHQEQQPSLPAQAAPLVLDRLSSEAAVPGAAPAEAAAEAHAGVAEQPWLVGPRQDQEPSPVRGQQRAATPAVAALPSPPRSPMLRLGSSSGSSGRATSAGFAAPLPGTAGCLQQCLAPPPPPQGVGGSSPRLPKGASPPRTALASSGSSRESLRSAGGEGRRSSTAEQSRASVGGGGGRREGAPYSRLNSIQLLESVQLGIDGQEGSVASHAALDVCERAQERVAGLQRCGSAGKPGGAGGGGCIKRTVSRVGSVAQRQAAVTAAPLGSIPDGG